eukprot:Blabericola_migrator_1__7434@NODE_378_length_9209_cov_129_909101_g302_i0_p6_GENE_NODE_378_length_9209_cov_129_909101_g302_i0NODE_378_length_9209_cov_129_909101_g302_i0_p6_ORF_typecomplete_len263_score45_26RRM_1/PF00076_22/1_6e06RRM_1/PF00076_22/7_7e03RRM_3/PF08777_11/0_00023Ebp2/PF05890_12/0_046WHEPTRS/PF00458_20/0_12_NODE_378_length_9209_cov_129_909101_g302_i078488636
MVRVFTLVVRRPPPGTAKADLHSFFSKFGPLNGEGIRFPNVKGDSRFFVDYKTLAAAKKALVTLNNKVHPEYPVFKFAIEWSPVTKREVQEAIQKLKAEKAKAAEAKHTESDSTDELFEESEPVKPSPKVEKSPTQTAAPKVRDKGASFSLADVLNAKGRKRDGREETGESMNDAAEDSVPLPKVLCSAAVILEAPPAGKTTATPAEGRAHAVIPFEALFTSVDTYYNSTASELGIGDPFAEIMSSISLPCLGVDPITIPML